jgi:hypothetical protein
MKNDARDQTSPQSHLRQWLEALRIQSEKLEDLALKTADWLEPTVHTAEDRRSTMARR